MPRGVQNKREALVKFLNPDLIPDEMKLTGKGAAKKGLPVVVLKQTAKTVELQYTPTKKGRQTHVERCTATFPIEAVVLYNVEIIEAPSVDAPKKKAASTNGRRKKKKVAAKAEEPGKKRRKKRKVRKGDSAAPEKRVRKKKKGRKKKFGSSSRRKTGFRLDEDD